jgi:hypothetical protein
VFSWLPLFLLKSRSIVWFGFAEKVVMIVVAAMVTGKMEIRRLQEHMAFVHSIC